jgi:hypothetical protein
MRHIDVMFNTNLYSTFRINLKVLFLPLAGLIA